MINLDSVTNKNNKKHNEKWPYIPDHPYRILIIEHIKLTYLTYLPYLVTYLTYLPYLL